MGEPKWHIFKLDLFHLKSERKVTETNDLTNVEYQPSNRPGLTISQIVEKTYLRRENIKIPTLSL